ncbi:MAG: MFS transporter, partial [Candidatus Hodarchaeota archaeon]
VFLLYLCGNVAFGVENSFFNVFMYNVIAPVPFYISMLVTFSAITATLSSVFMGTLSDKLGRRKAFFLITFPLWAVTTALYPLSGVLSPVIVAVWMAVIFDCLMTFFGATGYDAVLQAHMTDITNVENRAYLASITEIAGLIGILATYGLSSVIIDSVGYYAFFMIIAIMVGVLGIIGALLSKEPENIKPSDRSYMDLLKSTFSISELKKNRDIFLVLIGLACWGIGFQTFFPYLLVYLEHYLHYKILDAAILVLIAIIIAAVFSVPLGKLVDKYGRRKFTVFAIILCVANLPMFALVGRNLLLLVLFGSFWVIAMITFNISMRAWTRDMQPEDKRGQFAGLWMVFSVAISHSIGSMLGSLIAQTFGESFIDDSGQLGWIPPPLIFYVAAIIITTTLIPILSARESKIFTERESS